MKTFGRYLSYRLEKSILRTIVFTVLALLLTMSVVRETVFNMVEYSETGLYILATILGIICTVIPILETECFKNRRNLDTLYFLPISRFKMALAHYLSGWIQIMVIYSISYGWSAIYLLQNTNWFDLSHLLPYYFLSLLIGLVIYSIILFLFGAANTTFDGIVFCALGCFLFVMVCEGLNFCMDKEYLEMSWGLPYKSINDLTVLFQKKIHINKDQSYYQYVVPDILKHWYMFLFWGLLGILSAIGYFWDFVHKRAEQIGGISTSWFGYKTLIPIYCYIAFLIFGIENPMNTVVILGLMFAGYFIYRRSFRLRKSDFYLIAFSVLPLIAHEILMVYIHYNRIVS